MIDFKLILICLFFLTMLTVGRALYVTHGPDFNITKKSINITESLSESFFGVNGTINRNKNSVASESYSMQKITNIIYAWMEFVMKIIVELIGFAIVFGFENPQYNFKLIFDGLFYFVIVYLVVIIIKPLMMVGAIIYFGVRSIIDFVKKWKVSKSD